METVARVVGRCVYAWLWAVHWTGATLFGRRYEDYRVRRAMVVYAAVTQLVLVVWLLVMATT